MTNLVIAATIAVLVQVESQGRNVSGDQGRSAGVLQMKVTSVREANRLVGHSHWREEDRWYPERAKAVAVVILSHHVRLSNLP